MSTPLKPLIQQLIRDTIAEHNLINNQAANEQGTVTAVNDDGSINVQTASGAYSYCSTPKTRIVGDIVILLTADGKKVAL